MHGDLFGSKALLKLAGQKHLSEAEYLALYRPRAAGGVDDVRWTEHDVSLLDEARSYLGVRPAKYKVPGAKTDDDEIRTYGHIVVDEVQDFSPEALKRTIPILCDQVKQVPRGASPRRRSCS